IFSRVMSLERFVPETTRLDRIKGIGFLLDPINQIGIFRGGRKKHHCSLLGLNNNVSTSSQWLKKKEAARQGCKEIRLKQLKKFLSSPSYLRQARFRNTPNC